MTAGTNTLTWMLQRISQFRLLTSEEETGLGEIVHTWRSYPGGRSLLQPSCVSQGFRLGSK